MKIISLAEKKGIAINSGVTGDMVDDVVEGFSDH